MTKLTDAFQLRPWTLEDKGKHFFKENQRINRIEEDDDTQVYKKPWVGRDAEQSPKRTWVGLSAEDRWKIIYATEQDERITVMELVEARLKQKNT